jgi:uncharacterized damage-inducible protein DinB
MELGRLAGHLTEIPGWATESIQKDELDLAPPGAPPYEPTVFTSKQQILDLFDQNVATARKAIAGTSDEHILKSWSLLKGGQKLLTMPRIAVIRNFVLNHNVHHRAQLGVYLRLNDIPVPALYGPSADEGAM